MGVSSHPELEEDILSSDIVLTHGYFVGEDEREQQIMKPYAPLGLLYLSAYLKREGLKPAVFDSTFRSKEEMGVALAAGKGVIGLYSTHMTRRNVVWIAKTAKAAGWTVVAGGPDAANCPEQYLDAGVDVIVTGEGEATLAELLPMLDAQGRRRLHGVAGTVFRDEYGLTVRNSDRSQLAIDAIPWPDRDAIDMNEYLQAWSAAHGANSLSLITSRGCPFTCKWCSHSVFGHSYRHRNVRDCADEAAFLIERYHPDQLWYADDVFTMDGRWLLAYAAELRQRGIKIPFETISRADRLMNEEVIETLAAMGCVRLWIGSESGSDRMLSAMERRVTAEQVRWAVKRAKNRGIQVGMFLMWGYEGETVEDIRLTIEHVKESDPDFFFTTVVHPIRNTPYAREVANKTIHDLPWEISTDKDCRIRGRRSNAYYRQADRWLLGNVEAHRLAQRDPTAAAQKQTEAEEAYRALMALADDYEA